MRVVSVISGKGGSGKTSVSLALAQMLAILDRDVLLVDLDTSTHGASYFFGSEPPGLEEWVSINSSGSPEKGKRPDLSICVRKTKLAPPFDFLPSKTSFAPSDWDQDLVAESISSVAPAITSLLESTRYEFVILDCQAGVNIVTAAALKQSSDAIIVTEADSVSTKALRNLQNQFSHVLPKTTKAVINKLFLSETSTYDQLTSVLRGLEFLPPIPFDMEVRDAFARNVIPLTQDSPTAYFSAILRVARELFPELSETAERLSVTLRKVEFANYESEFGKLTQQRELVNDRINDLKLDLARLEERNERIRRLAIPMGIAFLSVLPYAYVRLLKAPLLRIDPTLTIGAVGAVLAYFWIVYDIFFRARGKAARRNELELQNLLVELKALDERTEKYTTLYVTERKKLLL